jgi:predicted nucleotide-binding protein (sugar kinase/HSP70/actin superfamily)
MSDYIKEKLEEDIIRILQNYSNYILHSDEKDLRSSMEESLNKVFDKEKLNVRVWYNDECEQFHIFKN